MVPALRFINWKEAEQYFRAKGASDATIETTHTALDKTGVAAMTIV
jgi:hypothetical protein